MLYANARTGDADAVREYGAYHGVSTRDPNAISALLTDGIEVRGGRIGFYGIDATGSTTRSVVATLRFFALEQAQEGTQDPLKDSHGYPVFTLDQFLEANGGKSFDDIINQRKVRNGLPGGPQMRMVLNPKDGNIMDMRHVMVVGYQYGRVGGYVFEISQFVRGIPQAFNGQDLYSNAIGDDFGFYLFVNWQGTKDWSKDFYDWMNEPK